jgi:hypothetical protein
MQGRMVDMDKLMQQNELTPAVGNMRVNARGDELGQGGRIVRKREDVVAEYYNESKAPTQEELEKFQQSIQAEAKNNKNKKGSTE